MHSKADAAAARLRAAAAALLNRVEHWTQSRWGQPATGDPDRSRADLVHDLVQRLADLAAEVEGRSPLPVPRLTNDLALPDQVRVMVADLGLAGAQADTLRVAADDITETAARL